MPIQEVFPAADKNDFSKIYNVFNPNFSIQKLILVCICERFLIVGTGLMIYHLCLRENFLYVDSIGTVDIDI